jgi:hypothetical protein
MRLAEDQDVIEALAAKRAHETQQLTLDPPVTPARVLPRQALR